MLLNRGVCVTAAVLCLSFAADAAPADAPLQPTGKWVLDYQHAQCVAARDYGPLTLAIKPAPNGETYELLVARSGSGPHFAQELAGTVDFGSGPVKSWLLRSRTVDKRHVLFVFRVSAAMMAQARSATSLRLRAETALDANFSLASMTALLEGMEKCTSDLMKYWNMGGEKDGRIAQLSRGDVRSIFSDWDYPHEAFVRRQEGSAQFLLLIDERGKIAGCHIVKTTGIPIFDSMGCQVMKERAKFSPARDPQGRAVRSTLWTPPIVWRMEPR